MVCILLSIVIGWIAIFLNTAICLAETCYMVGPFVLHSARPAENSKQFKVLILWPKHTKKSLNSIKKERKNNQKRKNRQ